MYLILLLEMLMKRFTLLWKDVILCIIYITFIYLFIHFYR